MDGGREGVRVWGSIAQAGQHGFGYSAVLLGLLPGCMCLGMWSVEVMICSMHSVSSAHELLSCIWQGIAWDSARRML